MALSITSLVALNSFKRDVHQSITGDARALHGGDLIIHSHYDFSPALLAAVNTLPGAVAMVRTWQFYSVVRNSGDETLFCNIMAVEPEYPLYGTVTLASGVSFQQQLAAGTTVELRAEVDPDLLGGLTVQVRDQLLDASIRGRLERLRDQLHAGARLR